MKNGTKHASRMKHGTKPLNTSHESDFKIQDLPELGSWHSEQTALHG